MRHGSQPHLYLDTCVIFDAVLEREKSAQTVIERIANHGWKCTTSRFTFAELLDTMQKEQQRKMPKPLTVRQLNRIYDRLENLLQEKYALIEFEEPSQPEFWEYVETIAGMSNIRARDAIHFATAYGGLCDLIVTSDKPFKKAAEQVPIRLRVPISLPVDIDDILPGIGFVVDEAGQATRV